MRILPFRILGAARYPLQLEEALEEAMHKAVAGQEKLLRRIGAGTGFALPQLLQTLKNPANSSLWCVQGFAGMAAPPTLADIPTAVSKQRPYCCFDPG
jgi:hypothetical protein